MSESSPSAKLPDWVQNHISRYIATDGADGYLWDATLGGGTGMIPTLLLTTTGRKSGKASTLPLIFGEFGSEYAVVASKGGAPAHPSWYLNLQANPKVKVQIKGDIFTAHARSANPTERAAMWPKMVDIYAPYTQYQAKTDRQIPIVVLKRA